MRLIKEQVTAEIGLLSNSFTAAEFLAKDSVEGLRGKTLEAVKASRSGISEKFRDIRDKWGKG